MGTRATRRTSRRERIAPSRRQRSPELSRSPGGLASGLAVLLAIGLAGFLGACSSSNDLALDDPLLAMRNPRTAVAQRVRAADLAWAEAAGPGASAADRDELRRASKALAWSDDAPAELRLALIDRLARDASPGAAEDTREMVRLMLPREPDPRVTSRLCSLAADRGWEECTPALVRSWSRTLSGVPDGQRAERAAILSLHPGRDADEVVWSVFLDPRTEEGPFGIDWPQRTRSDAWDLLARVDPRGDRRGAWLDAFSAGPNDATANPAIEVLRAARRDLRLTPVTGAELAWLTSLHAPDTSAWWSEASAGLATLDESRAGGLRLRHAEAVRWARAARPGWMLASRDELLAELSARLERRTIHPRSTLLGTSRPTKERLTHWAAVLSWADLVAILAADEALADPTVVSALFRQRDQDRADTTTEYGGVLRIDTAGADSNRFRAVLYPPRPSHRLGDDRFVASADMVSGSRTALAHYHFHAARTSNRSVSGPSDGDLDYAATSGRTCLVLTSLSDTRMGVDLYQPDGVILDLGELVRADQPPAASRSGRETLASDP